jgi:hypothetical protein
VFLKLVKPKPISIEVIARSLGIQYADETLREKLALYRYSLPNHFLTAEEYTGQTN